VVTKSSFDTFADDDDVEQPSSNFASGASRMPTP